MMFPPGAQGHKGGWCPGRVWSVMQPSAENSWNLRCWLLWSKDRDLQDDLRVTFVYFSSYHMIIMQLQALDVECWPMLNHSQVNYRLVKWIKVVSGEGHFNIFDTIQLQDSGAAVKRLGGVQHHQLLLVGGLEHFTFICPLIYPPNP